jgi:hypothetical protein
MHELLSNPWWNDKVIEYLSRKIRKKSIEQNNLAKYPTINK